MGQRIWPSPAEWDSGHMSTQPTCSPHNLPFYKRKKHVHMRNAVGVVWCRENQRPAPLETPQHTAATPSRTQLTRRDKRVCCPVWGTETLQQWGREKANVATIQWDTILIKWDSLVFLGDKTSHLKKLRRFAVHPPSPLNHTPLPFNWRILTTWPFRE